MSLSRSASAEVQGNVVDAIGIDNHKLVPKCTLRIATMVANSVTKLQAKT